MRIRCWPRNGVGRPTHPAAYAVLNAADEKNRRGSNIPLRADLAAELSSWLDERLSELQEQTSKNGSASTLRSKNQSRKSESARPVRSMDQDRESAIPVRLNGEGPTVGSAIQVRLPASTRLFRVPTGLTRIFNRDLAVAGIPKRDDRNRVVDVHALRVTFGTHLSAAGVPLRTAQAAMRHSKPELTANVYTDPKLLNVAGAIDALPALALEPATGGARRGVSR
jgi:integrase